MPKVQDSSQDIQNGPILTRQFSAQEIADMIEKDHDMLLGFIRALVRNYSDAEDVFQEVSVAAVELRQQLQSEEGYGPWIRQIARYRVLKHFEKAKKFRLENAVVDQITDIVEKKEQQLSDRVEFLQDCIDQLPVNYRQMVMMRYQFDQEKYSVEQIADKVGRSVQATYTLLKRIRQQLRDCVSTKMAGGRDETR